MFTLNTIIAQYRTGGQNLTHWLKEALRNEFIVIHEPFNKSNEDYTKDFTLQDFTWMTDKKYFIKELWYPGYSYDKILNLSNKTICIYRENIHEHTISHLYSTKKNKYHHQYTQKDINDIFNQHEYDEFKNEVQINKETLFEFASENNLPLISYEELYYKNGIERFKEIFEFDSKIPFPFGEKYFTNSKKII